MEQSTRNRFRQLMTRTPDARAQLRGSDAYPNICGAVSFWQTNAGVLILAEVSGLPRSNSVCERPIFAMHIHEGEHCTGNEMDPFAATGGHYNPDHCPHPFHAGDLPPLFSNDGTAWMVILIHRFTVRSILGRTVVLHQHADDFTTQPSGASGAKIACGVICSTRCA